VSAEQVIARLRPKLSHVAGASLYLQASQDLRIGGVQSNAQYQYAIQTDNLQDLNKWGRSCCGRCASAGAHRRQLQPAERRPAGCHRVRPRHRSEVGAHAADDR